MKKDIKCISTTIFLMLIVPCLAVTLVPGDMGMVACFMLFYVINPLYAISIGKYASKQIKQLWYLPIMTSFLYLAGTWLFFGMNELAFVYYALIYLVLGITSMLIFKLFKRRNKSNKAETVE